jgi:hypothetical protein
MAFRSPGPVVRCSNPVVGYLRVHTEVEEVNGERHNTMNLE